MPRRGPSARAAALRRAQQAKATRDAARLRREQDIEAALADYFEATGRAEQARAEARRKADRILADAERAAETPRQAASAAIHRLRELVGTTTEVASLCGISAGEVRTILAKPVRRSSAVAAAAGPSPAEPESGGLPAHPAAEPGTVPQGPPSELPDHGFGPQTADDDAHG